MHRLITLFLALCTLFSCALAHEVPPLASCTTVDEVLALVDLPMADETGDVLPLTICDGMLRYIGQNPDRDPLFCADYWLGGEPGSELDLTVERAPNHTKYLYSARSMCTRAAYSMILSYFGIDMTPGAMSALMNKRDLGAPYDDVTKRIPGIQRSDVNTRRFEVMWERYQSDPSTYSPIYLYFEKPEGGNHALLIVAATGDSGKYIVVDPSYHEVDGAGVPVYTISLNINYKKIVNSTFRLELKGSRVKWFYQWERTDK